MYLRFAVGAVGSILSTIGGESELPEEVENRELYYSEITWLLSGNGRWNVDKDLAAKEASRMSKAQYLKEQQLRNVSPGIRTATANFSRQYLSIMILNNHLASKGAISTSSGLNKTAGEWTPAAFLSLTAPRIAVDAVSDASTIFTLGMQNNTNIKIEEP